MDCSRCLQDVTNSKVHNTEAQRGVFVIVQRLTLVLDLGSFPAHGDPMPPQSGVSVTLAEPLEEPNTRE